MLGSRNGSYHRNNENYRLAKEPVILYLVF